MLKFSIYIFSLLVIVYILIKLLGKTKKEIDTDNEDPPLGI